MLNVPLLLAVIIKLNKRARWRDGLKGEGLDRESETRFVYMF
jgi:hypothetical protein